MTAEASIQRLIGYAEKNGLIGEEDRVYAVNRVMDVLGIQAAEFSDVQKDAEPESGKESWQELEEILGALLDYAVEGGRIDDTVTEKDLLSTRIMDCVTPRPGEVIRDFRRKWEESPRTATDDFYRLNLASDYIREYRVRRDRKWKAATPYGELDITINLSKPEKDPKAIAAALKDKRAAYPKCLLCHENEGYAGRFDHPARQTLRQIPLTLGGERWYLQYSPYTYYNEHCIVLSGEHRPMKIDRMTFVRLLEFIRQFPHYTAGSNADLPIVGGSILTHEHYQGGRYEFAMERALLRETVSFPGFSDVEAGIVRWPMSVIRLRSEDPGRLAELSEHIRSVWSGYSDREAEILAFTDAPHNTVTPIARMRGGKYEMDLVLRNNRTSEEHPLGIFHPHRQLHHIKKENIGLIEVMGLAVLPARLEKELAVLKEALLGGEDVRGTAAAVHAEWAEELAKRYAGRLGRHNADAILEQEVGAVFLQVLEHAGVFKDTEAGRMHFDRFLTRCREKAEEKTKC
ncbi:MAG: UDP-glucose--hexose-1-phosphate uridylyltransferase [Lachnospiraceae bacterium]|nr:UDP-glucose--hexose-1-phosphate uridylyltransferase [Lachnospiraceae bacterium]